MARSKLALGLAAEKGIDISKAKEKKRLKALRKKKGGRGMEGQARENGPGEDEAMARGLPEWEGVGGSEGCQSNEREEDRPKPTAEKLDETDSDSEVEMEERIARGPSQAKPNNVAAQPREGIEVDEEEEGDIPMSDIEELSDADREDIIPHSRLTINNTSALLTSLKRIELPTDSSRQFTTHQSIISVAVTADKIPDVSDDLQRELQFYKQSRDAVLQARSLLRQEGVPFSRPSDYFAEMVKGDEHVEKMRAKLVEEASAKKASAEARKLREQKKFGKQVQIAKLQARQKAKKESLEKIKLLKRKRQDSSGNLDTHEADDDFDVAVDNELDRDTGGRGAGKRRKTAAGDATDAHVPNAKRRKKNEKYGFGGKKRHSKSGDALSSGDLSGFSVRNNKTSFKGKTNRPGKTRRKAMASRG